LAVILNINYDICKGAGLLFFTAIINNSSPELMFTFGGFVKGKSLRGGKPAQSNCHIGQNMVMLVANIWVVLKTCLGSSLPVLVYQP